MSKIEICATPRLHNTHAHHELTDRWLFPPTFVFNLVDIYLQRSAAVAAAVAEIRASTLPARISSAHFRGGHLCEIRWASSLCCSFWYFYVQIQDVMSTAPNQYEPLSLSLKPLISDRLQYHLRKDKNQDR